MWSLSSTKQIIKKMPGQPAAEIKYDESETRKKLVKAIARHYQEKLEADKDKPLASVVFDNLNSAINMEDYLKKFLSLEKISVMAFLHMTLLIDSWFRHHPKDRFGRENSYALIVASLCLAHDFHDGDFDYKEFEKEDEDDLLHRNTHLTLDFAKKAGTSFITLCAWMNTLKQGINNQFHYTQEEYITVQKKLLLLEDRDPAYMQLSSDLAEFAPVAAETFRKKLNPGINDELPIKKILIPRIAARVHKIIEEAKSRPFVPSPFDFPPGSPLLEITTVEDYLKRFIHPDVELTVYIHLAIILESWVKNNRRVDLGKEGYYPVEKVKNNKNEPDSYSDQYYSLNKNNWHTIILISLALAENYCTDRPFKLKSIPVIGGLSTQGETSFSRLELLQDVFVISTGGKLLDPSQIVTSPFPEDVYECYHNALLPEYNLDLTLRQQPVVPDKKNEDSDEEEKRANCVITSLVKVYDDMCAKKSYVVITNPIFLGSRINCSLQGYMLRIREYTKASAETFIYMCVFLDIYLSNYRDRVEASNVHRLLFTSFVIAWQQKYPGGKENQHNDLTELLKIAGISLSELTQMETALMAVLNKHQFCHAQHKGKSLSEVYDFFSESLLAYPLAPRPTVGFRV